MAAYSVIELPTLIKGKKITYLISVGANPLYAHNSYTAEDSGRYILCKEWELQEYKHREEMADKEQQYLV